MRIGAHISVAGGYPKAVEYALDVGCECVQIFAKSPRQWNAPPTDPARAQEFVELRTERGLGPLFTHTAYLINLASNDDDMWRKSVNALADEISRGRLMGADGVVTHLGSNRDPERACERVVEGVDQAFQIAERLQGSDREPGTRLVLENSVGAGHHYGGPIAQIAEVICRTDTPSALLGVCLDTCHAYAFGIDLTSDGAWRDVLADIGGTCGEGALRVVHANDCMFELGSRRDRHAWIGDGMMGNGAFEAMTRALVGTDVCVITEMPGEVPEKDIENLSRLKRMREHAEKPM